MCVSLILSLGVKHSALHARATQYNLENSLIQELFTIQATQPQQTGILSDLTALF